MPRFCRDCLKDVAADEPPDATRCPDCGGRVVGHVELYALSIAHIDCDAFYATIEKRDDPKLKDVCLIVGGGKRGVVTTACYNARKFGVRSAMPMFQALKLCPHAVVVRPNMEKYAAVANEVRELLRTLTPQVESTSIDEAYLDLSGTERLHGMAPAKTLAKAATAIELQIGITVSVGLSCNKFLAKLASDLDKPRGFAVIGEAEAKSFLRDKPVSMIRGVGPATAERLARDGITMIYQLQDGDRRKLAERYGETGLWLYRLANGEDARDVDPSGERKSISSETTFESDIADYKALERILWEQAEETSSRAKEEGMGGRTITLKLKTSSFKLKTRSASLESPTQLSNVIFKVGQGLLKPEANGARYRLLGIGLHQLRPAAECDPPDLVDKKKTQDAAVERAMDSLRAKFGDAALKKGRSLS